MIADFVVYILLGLGIWALWIWFQKQTIDDCLLQIQFFPLLVFHLIVSFYFNDFIDLEGGDAERYWSVTADLSQYASSWMQYFGFSTFFIQWLNYYPAKIWDLSFLTGNLIYSCISFLGIIWGLLLTRLYFPKTKGNFLIAFLPFLVWWFPGLHFWTAGVGKESLLFIGLIGSIWSISFDRLNVFGFLIGAGILIMVRPVWGIFIVVPLLFFTIKKWKSNLISQLVIVAFTSILVWKGLGWIWERAHLKELSVNEFTKFSSEQLAFLEGYEANSSLPIQTMSFGERMFAVSFRPFPWEIWSWQSLIYSLENLIFLILLFLIPIAIVSKRIQIRWRPLLVILGILLVWVSFSLTLNNYGVIYRMKSIWLPPLFIALLWLIWPFVLSNKSKV